MRDRRESVYPQDWFRKAYRDFKRVEQNLKEGDYEDAAFHLQQTVEKYLKGYLLSKGWKLKKIHDLEYLLDEAIKFKPDLEVFRSLCQEITGYYFIERYPFLVEEPSLTELNYNFKIVSELIQKLLPKHALGKI